MPFELSKYKGGLISESSLTLVLLPKKVSKHSPEQKIWISSP